MRAGRSNHPAGNCNLSGNVIVSSGGYLHSGYTLYVEGGNTLLVAGAGSIFTVGLQINGWGSPVSWTVSNGGKVWFSKEFSLGARSGCANNIVTVTGPGSRWTHFVNNMAGVPTSRILIGVDTAYNNYLNVYDGGAVSVTNLVITGSSNALNLGNGTGVVSRAWVEAGNIVLSDAGARLNMNHGILSTGASGMLVSGAGSVSNAGPAYFSIPADLVCEIGSAITGPGPLIKEGGGKLTLSGANTYTGATSVSNGTLALKQALLHDGSDVYVVSGSKLALDFIGDDWIGSLYWDDEAQPRGTYAVGDLGGAITGTGRLRVTSAETNEFGGVWRVGLRPDCRMRGQNANGVSENVNPSGASGFSVGFSIQEVA